MQVTRTRPALRRGGIVYLSTEDIVPNPVQPRKLFDDEGLEELSRSIKDYGILNPLSVRLRGSRYELSLDELAECIPAPALDEAVEARALGLAIDAFLDTVSKDSRVIFLRRYWFGDSVKEIARSLGMTQNAVSVRLNRTRQQLHTYLYKEGYLDA